MQALMRLLGQLDLKPVAIGLVLATLTSLGGFVVGRAEAAAEFKRELADHGRVIEKVRALPLDALARMPSQMERLELNQERLADSQERIERSIRGTRPASGKR